MGPDTDPGHPQSPGGRSLRTGSGKHAELAELARLFGVQLSYSDQVDRRHHARREAVLAALRALGAPIEGLDDVSDAIRHRRKELWQRRIEPVIVAWEGRMPDIAVRLPAAHAQRRIRCRVEVQGEDRIELAEVDGLDPSSSVDLDGRAFVEGHISAHGFGRLPHGYHRLTVEVGSHEADALVISAPVKAAPPPPGRRWGVFIPMHALRTSRSLGIGDFTDLRSLTGWVASQGGSMVATLPFLAAFLDDPLFDPSPYAPASRLFWNELFVDPEAAPEVHRSAEARTLLSSSSYRRSARDLASRPLVDYRATMALKRRVLEALARSFWSDPGPRRSAFEAFAERDPGVFDYAAFRAALERHRRPWAAWPARERDGHLPPEGGNPDGSRYHLYAQWLAEEQVHSAAHSARSEGAGLYFDMPLGVNPAGFDAWMERDAFLSGVSAGAPPDAFFAAGQDWGFRPLAPDAVRAQHYRYPIAVIHRLVEHAAVLRLDHAMGLHRLYVVPDGMSAKDGLYIRYRPEELYAILCLESQRSGTVLVGEDLGMVPDYVPRSLHRHGIQQTYVTQFELLPKRPSLVRKGMPRHVVLPPAENVAASFNTHDMAPFAGFWHGVDIDRGVKLGWMSDEEAVRQRAERERQKRMLVSHLISKHLLPPGITNEERVLRAALAYLATSRARMVVVSLEDLWLETDPQNVPGTTDEYPNWRRRARYTFEQFRGEPGVTGTLIEVDELRKRSERHDTGRTDRAERTDRTERRDRAERDE